MAKVPKPEHLVPGAPKHAARKRKNQPSAKKRYGGPGNTKKVAKANMTPKRWERYLANVANGMSHREASHDIGLTMQTVDAYLISNVAATMQIREAKLLWRRREWPLEKIYDVLEQIAMGATLKEAFEELGIPDKRRAGLYQILLQDKAIRKLYDDARELQVETFSDEVIEISDDAERDWKDNGKPNHELVNRSRLRVDTRKFLMGALNARRFGGTKHHIHEGELNINHAAVLSGGRKRLEKLHAKRKGMTIDGESEEVVSNE